MYNSFPKISNTGFWHDTHPDHACSPGLSKWIVEYLKDAKDKQILDFGCAIGQYLKRLQDAGFTKLTGFEGNPPPEREFANVIQQDLAVPFTVPTKGNVICLEVAEHIPAKYEDIFLNNLANACDDKLIMSWAIRGQGGWGHFNELNNDEAIDKVVKHGFIYLPEDTASARLSVAENDLPWFKNTTLIFKKGQ